MKASPAAIPVPPIPLLFTLARAVEALVELSDLEMQLPMQSHKV
jgi:hypothetical protein